ncbi:MAG TPA: hypothetical protein EYG67_04530 [Campylobacterales bacterium]|nr:hypothetical protein [Campylobacterales bacterium]HIP41409.1 hypothetical protein [Campylobacterales bacterium]
MFGEFDEMILYHAVLIKMLLGLLVVGMMIPFLSSACEKIIKRTRIYMFIFHGFMTSVAFSGLVAFVFVQMSFNASMGFMIVAYLLMSAIESVKYLLMLQTQKESDACNNKMRIISLKYTMINIVIVALFVVYKIMEHSSTVPL